MISIELHHVGSYEDEQLKVLNPYFVFSWAESWTWNVISSWSTWFQVFYNVCIVRTMANSLIAVVSYCMHCKVCMHLNHGICTFSTDYLYCLLAYDMLQFLLNEPLSYTTSLVHAHAHAHIFHPLWQQASLTSVLCVPFTQLVKTSHLPPAPSHP